MLWHFEAMKLSQIGRSGVQEFKSWPSSVGFSFRGNLRFSHTNRALTKFKISKSDLK